MKTIQITIGALANTRYLYPPHLELFVNDDFLAIDHIMPSDGLYVIQCQNRTWTLQPLDEVTIRYRNNNIIDCLPYPAPLIRNDDYDLESQYEDRFLSDME